MVRISTTIRRQVGSGYVPPELLYAQWSLTSHRLPLPISQMGRRRRYASACLHAHRHLTRRGEACYKAANDPVVVDRFMKKARLPTWEALEEQMRKGPPAFLRPGWRSPLLGKRVDLSWLDSDAFECIRPSKDGWKNKKVVVIEFWAS